MGKDKLTGAGILLACIVFAIAYVLLLYFGYGSALAIILVSAAFFVLLGLIGWIGLTIATTSTPKPIEVGSEAQPKEIVVAGKTKRGRPRKKD